MALGRRGGCFIPLLIIFIATAIVLDDEGGGNSWRTSPRQIPAGHDPAGPPLGPEAVPELGGYGGEIPEFGIADTGRQKDSQGTGFAVAPEGVWLTAEHVVKGCDRVGLATGPRSAEGVGPVFESRVSDAAAISGGARTAETLALSTVTPREGDDGYHMGFPQGAPAVVHSHFMGRGSAVRPGRSETVLAWAEVERFPEFDHSLAGISGGPTLDSRGRVVGINSAAGERRGRVLTTYPAASINLLQAARLPAAAETPARILNPADAVARFRALIESGSIRQVYCDVFE